MSIINYRIHSITSESQNYPASNLVANPNFNLSSPQQGWQSDYSCTFPQQLNLEFFLPIKTKKLELTFHQYKIPSSVEVFVRMARKESWRKLGFVIPDDNSQSNFQNQQIKTLYFEFPCTYVKLLFNQNYKNEMNILEQVALVKATVTGQILSRSEVKQWNLYQQDSKIESHGEGEGDSGSDSDYNEDEDEDENNQSQYQAAHNHKPVESINSSQLSSIHPVAKKSSNNNLKKASAPNLQHTSTTDEFLRQFGEVYSQLQSLKQQAVEKEDFQQAASLKNVIAGFKQIQKDIIRLQTQKRHALEQEDFDKCHRIKQEIIRKKETFTFKKQQFMANQSGYISDHSHSRVLLNQQQQLTFSNNNKKYDSNNNNNDGDDDNNEIGDYFGTPEKEKRKLHGDGNSNNFMTNRTNRNNSIENNDESIVNSNDNDESQIDHNSQVIPALRKKKHKTQQPLEYPAGDPRNNPDYVHPQTEHEGKVTERSNKRHSADSGKVKGNKSLLSNQSKKQLLNKNISTSNKLNNNSSHISSQSRLQNLSKNYSSNPAVDQSVQKSRDSRVIGQKNQQANSMMLQPQQQQNQSNLSNKNKQNKSNLYNPDDRPINPQKPEQLKLLIAEGDIYQLTPKHGDQEQFDNQNESNTWKDPTTKNKNKKGNAPKLSNQKLKPSFSSHQSVEHGQQQQLTAQMQEQHTRQLRKKYDLKPLDVNTRLKLQHYFSIIKQPYWEMISTPSWKTKKDALEMVLAKLRIVNKQSYMAALEFASLSIQDKHTQVVISTLNLLSEIISQGQDNEVVFSLPHLPYFVQDVMQALLALLTSTNKQLFEYGYNLYLNFGLIGFLSGYTLLNTLIKYKQAGGAHGHGYQKHDAKLMLNKLSLMISIVQKYPESAAKYFKDIVSWATMYLQDPNNKVKNEASYLMLIMVDMIGEDKVINVIKAKPKALQALYTLLNTSSLMDGQGIGQELGLGQKETNEEENRSEHKKDAFSKNKSSLSTRKQEESLQQPSHKRTSNPWSNKSNRNSQQRLSSKNSIDPHQSSEYNVELQYSREQSELRNNLGSGRSRQTEEDHNQSSRSQSSSAYSQNKIRVMQEEDNGYEEENQQQQQQNQQSYAQDNQNDDDDICDFCFQPLLGVDQRTHLIRQCKIISCCEECYGRIYLREMSDHMLKLCKYKEFHQKCKVCELAFKIDEISLHVAQGLCRPAKGEGWERCQFCFEDVEADDMKWADHAQRCNSLPQILSQEGQEEEIGQ